MRKGKKGWPGSELMQKAEGVYKPNVWRRRETREEGTAATAQEKRFGFYSAVAGCFIVPLPLLTSSCSALGRG